MSKLNKVIIENLLSGLSVVNPKFDVVKNLLYNCNKDATSLYESSKKACQIRPFLLYLDAPYNDFLQIFVIKIVRNTDLKAFYFAKFLKNYC